MIIEYYSNGTPYVPFALQMEEFRKKYPLSKIDVQVTPDIDHQPNTYIGCATLWSDAASATESNYIIKVSARRSQTEVSEEGTDEISAYDAAVVAALRKALNLLGFGVPYEKQKQLQSEYLASITSVSGTADESISSEKVENPVVEESIKEMDVTPTTSEVVETPSSPVSPAPEKRGRKPKQKEPTPTVKENIPAEPDEPTEAIAEDISTEDTRAVPTKESLEKQAGMTYEEALALPCNHQSYTETMGELADKYPQIFNWMLTSPFHAKTKKKEHAAAILISAVRNL